MQSRKRLIEPIIVWLAHRPRSPSLLRESILRQETIKETSSLYFPLFPLSGLLFLSFPTFLPSTLVPAPSSPQLDVSLLFENSISLPVWILFGSSFFNHLKSPLRLNLYHPAPPPSPPIPLSNQEVCAGNSCPPTHNSQVHPGNGAMCDGRHVADIVRGVVTVIKITLNFIW